MNIKGVVFDMDGVILDTEKYLHKFWIQAAKECGFDLPEDVALNLRSLAGEFRTPYLESVFGKGFDYENVRNLRMKLMEEHISRNGLELKPYVKELLDFLSEQKISAAVATATDEKRTKSYLESVGVYDRFSHIICASQLAHGKPKPDIYIYACRKLGISPSECLAIEDSPNGVKSACGAGCKTVFVPDLTDDFSEFENEIFAVCKSLEEVRQLLCFDK